jgi:hypothetical protein
MGDVQKPQAGIGGDFREGVNPHPGGIVDTGDTPVMPYADRSQGGDASASSRALTDTIDRQLENTASTGEAEIGKVGGGNGATNVDPATGKAGSPISADEINHGNAAPSDPNAADASVGRAGNTLEPPATEHKGATNRPVGQVEGDLMEPNNSGAGTSDVD